MTQSVVVTGAAGFIGQHTVKKLHHMGIAMHLLSRHGGSIDNLSIDVVDLAHTEQVFNWAADKSFDAIIHLAADIPHQLIGSAAQASFLLNTNSMLNVLELAKQRQAYLIYASGTSVYGTVDQLPITEHTLPHPENFYTSSKYVGDVLCEQTRLSEGLAYASLRISAPYGVGSTARTVINIFLARALAGEDLTLYGTGAREQDFIDVDDVAEAILLALVKRPVGVFNIARGQAVSMKTLAETIIQVTQSKTSRIVYADKPDPQEQYRAVFSIDRARDVLGWQPQISLQQGLQKMLAEKG